MNQDSSPLRVFTFVRTYLPAYKSGGPVRTIANMADWLRGQVEFSVFCRDRDSGDSEPFAGVKVDDWNQWGPAKVFYSSEPTWHWRQVRRQVSKGHHDVVYLNSFFCSFTIRYLLLRYFRLVPRQPVVIAPRGEFSQGALAIKPLKKRVFIWGVSKVAPLYRGLIWQASSEFEREEIFRVLGRERLCLVAPDLPQRLPLSRRSLPAKPAKVPGELRIVFISRIAPKKNLTFLFPVLHQLRGRIAFDIFGPPEDSHYMARCEHAAAECGSHVTVAFRGPIPNDEVLAKLAEYHLFAFPTLGENFGHVILESLLAGNPVVVSDQTPWRNLAERGVGHDLPLSDPGAWVQVLQGYVDLSQAEFRRTSTAAFTYGAAYTEQPPLAANVRLFQEAITSEAGA